MPGLPGEATGVAWPAEVTWGECVRVGVPEVRWYHRLWFVVTCAPRYIVKGSVRLP
jgi:hypothetical protein